MLKKILVPVDGSKDSFIALEYALRLGKNFNSEILILNVVPELYATEFDLDSGWVKSAKERILASSERVLAEAKDKAKDYSGTIMTKSLIGYPSYRIVAVAEEENIDMIVIGSRGLGKFTSTILGSVSSGVVNHSTVPVTVVKA